MNVQRESGEGVLGNGVSTEFHTFNKPCVIISWLQRKSFQLSFWRLLDDVCMATHPPVLPGTNAVTGLYP